MTVVAGAGPPSQQIAALASSTLRSVTATPLTFRASVVSTDAEGVEAAKACASHHGACGTNRKGGIMHSHRRTSFLAAVALAVAATVALAVVPTARNSSTTAGLSAYVDTNTRGPVPAQSIVRQFVHVLNSNDIGPGPLGVRQTIANALVLDSVDIVTFFNGEQVGDPFTVAAPPNSSDFTGRWPTTVTGNVNNGFQVGRPAIIPGENTVAFYVGQPLDLGAGKYVYKYVLHGTLNGSPVELTAISPQVIAAA